MRLLTLDIDSLCTALEDAARDIVDAFDEGGEAAPDDLPHPELLSGTISQYAEVLRRADADRRGGTGNLSGAAASDPRNARPANPDLSELCDYGLSLIGELARWSARLGLATLQEQTGSMAFPLALWMARNDAELRMLEPVVDALARIANHSADTGELEQLCGAMGEIIDAVSPLIRQDLESANPGRPWRILNLNRGIVATRSRNPALMETAFRALVENLPDDAPEFFREGMAQMDALDYPRAVRAVMEKYYNESRIARTLH